MTNTSPITDTITLITITGSSSILLAIAATLATRPIRERHRWNRILRNAARDL